MSGHRTHPVRGERDRQAAERLGLAFVPLAGARLSRTLSPGSHLANARNGVYAKIETAAGESLAIVPTRLGTHGRMAERIRQMARRGKTVVASSGDEIVDLYLRDSHARIVDRALHALPRRFPQMSARRTFGSLQVVGLVAALAALGWAARMRPFEVSGWLFLTLCMVFLSASAIRLAALVSRVPSSRPWIELPDADLPVYTILVPLFHEAAIVPDLVSALESLDYPRDRLDIKILLEEDDEETIAAFARADLPSHYCLMRLPDKGPRTKPKALCVGLALARGSLVCVFDAEDRPEPDQLRQAAGAFAIAPPQVCCLQARLAYANWNQSLLTRQFAIEYAALFDVMVPYITWARLPLPLGGTSNHFRTSILREAGGWDPYNVTEDADLGIRLARLGYEVGAIDSTTYEEAPATLGAWIKQRTRWMKGWMQTLIVHTRRPMQLFFQLGMIGSLGFVATVVANLVSAIVHPLALALLAWQGLSGEFLSAADMLGATVTAVASANLIFGYAIALACAAVGVYRRPMRGLALHLVATPVYWLLSAVALVLAVIDLIRRPHFWAKTEHGTARREAPAPLRAKRSAKKT